MSEIEQIDKIIKDMSEAVTEITSFKQGYNKLNEIKDELEKGIAFFQANQDFLNSIKIKQQDLQSELNNTKNTVKDGLNSFSSRAINLENTFVERANQIQERITNLDSKFSKQLENLQVNVKNLEKSLLNKIEEFKISSNKQLSNIMSDIEKKSESLDKQMVALKDELNNSLNNINKLIKEQFVEYSKNNKQILKKIFVFTVIILVAILSMNGYIIYTLLNNVK